jgi:hypothetical protein
MRATVPGVLRNLRACSSMPRHPIDGIGHSLDGHCLTVPIGRRTYNFLEPSSRHLHEDAGFSVDLVAGRRITGSLLDGAQNAKGPLPGRPRRYRKNRWLRGPQQTPLRLPALRFAA